MTVNKNQILKGVLAFIDNDMIPRASGNYKIILRGFKAIVSARFDAVFDSLKKNPLISLAGVVEGDTLDLDLAATVLTEALSTEEYSYSFGLLGDTYSIHIAASDVAALKKYIVERN